MRKEATVWPGWVPHPSGGPRVLPLSVTSAHEFLTGLLLCTGLGGGHSFPTSHLFHASSCPETSHSYLLIPVKCLNHEVLLGWLGPIFASSVCIFKNSALFSRDGSICCPPGWGSRTGDSKPFRSGLMAPGGSGVTAARHREVGCLPVHLGVLACGQRPRQGLGGVRAGGERGPLCEGRH